MSSSVTSLSDEEIPPPPQSPDTPKMGTPRNRSVSGKLLSSFKSHLTVVRAAISHGKHHSPRSDDDNGAGGPPMTMMAKEGELYSWNDVGAPTRGTPALRKSSSSSCPSNMVGAPQQQNRELLEQSNHSTVADAMAMDTLTMGTGSSAIPPTSQQQQQPSTAEKQRTFYTGGLATTAAEAAAGPYSPRNSSHSKQSERSTPDFALSWSEQFFFSQDDESVSVYEQGSSNSPRAGAADPNANDPGVVDQNSSFPSIRPMDSVKFEPIDENLPPNDETSDEEDDETCNNTIVEKVRQRSKKASRASTVGAFVTFLKALFGIGMLSNPAVLGEVGLLLGTFCHLFIVIGCAFACYLLLAARQLAKLEVFAKQTRDEEKREEYELWRREMENRAAARAGRGDKMQFVEEPVGMGGQQVIQPPSPLPIPQNADSAANNAMTPAVSNSSSASELLDASGRTTLGASGRTLQVVNTGSTGDEDWTIAPVPLGTVPLSRVATSMPPKQGWGRCEEALHNATGRRDSDCNSPDAISTHKYAATQSCGNVQMTRQSTKKSGSRSGSRESLNDTNYSPNQRSNKSKNSVSDEYQRFTDNIHNNYMPILLSSRTMPPMPPPPPPTRPAPVRLTTYGDVAKYLAGKRASIFIVFTIVTVHLMFASGMVHIAVENLCYVVGWERLGWSYTQEYYESDGGGRGRRLGPSEDEGDDDRAGRSSDEEEYYLEWKGPDFIGRLAMASLLFPIIHALLQIPNLTELATISTVGLFTYAFGCIGSMLYTALVLTDGHPFMDQPDDMWKTKWSGIPTYVATTIYCIEGINLALPTVSSIEGTQRWGGGLMNRSGTSQAGSSAGGSKKETERQDLSVFIVVGAVFLYGMVTLVVSWIGLAGGLGGGTGTIHGEDGCWDVTYCLNSSAVRFVYMLSLGVALVLTLPVILYPSTEMLEVWLDERNDERRRKMEQQQEAVSSPMSQGQGPIGVRPFWRTQKSLLPDDETVYTVNDIASPRQLKLGIKHEDIEMRELSCSTAGVGDYIAPNCSGEPSPISLQNENDSTDLAVATPRRENAKLKAKRKLKYWKLRMFLAFIICVIGTIEGSSPTVLKLAEVLRGVGLSICGLIFPPLLYMSAVGGNFSVPMAVAMALLIGLGLFNIVLVLMSAFGSRDFIVEEGRGNFYEM